MMRNLVLKFGVCFLLVLSACAEKDTTFLITDLKVGKVDKISLIRDLELIYEGDSLVKDTLRSRVGGSKKIKVFEKGGKHLLTITPSNDSIPTIQNIKIEDPRFQTENGIGLESTFKDVLDRFEIKKVVTTLNSVVIFPKGTSLYFTIDKSELPESLRYSTGDLDAVQIPDEAKIKYLMIGWEP